MMRHFGPYLIAVVLGAACPAFGVGESRFFGGSLDGAARGNYVSALPSALIQRYNGGPFDGSARCDRVTPLPPALTQRYQGGAFDGTARDRALNLPNPLNRDSDGDTLPDWWELQYYPGVTNALPESDLDHDGMSDQKEYVSDTDPRAATSSFRITLLTLTSNAQVRFVCSTQRVYDLTYSGTPNVTSQWTGVGGQTNLAGTGSVMILRDNTPPSTSRFYRVNVRIP
jgi:hypothetical protein